MRTIARTPALPLVLAVLLALVSLRAAAGPLRWDSTEIAVDAPPLAESVEVAFKFTNDSEKPVTIENTHSSCGCTVPRLDQKIYVPGESGTIRAVFTIGERIGLQEKTIMVTTAAPDASSTVLTLRVSIPTLFEVKPYFVIWNTGETPAAKSIDLRLLAPDVLAFDGVASRHANFTATTTPGAAPGALRVSITPASTAQPTNGGIEITLKAPDGKTRQITVYALVRGGPIAPSPATAGTSPAASAPAP